MKKNFLSRRALCVFLIFLIVFVSYGAYTLLSGGRQTLYANYNSAYVCDGAQVLFGDGYKNRMSDIVEIESVEILDGYAKAVIRAADDGDEHVGLRVSSHNPSDSSENETVVTASQVKVRGGIIISKIDDQLYVVLSALSLLLAVYYLYCFINEVKHRRFSYDTLFFLATVLFFALLLALWGSATVYSYLNFHTVSSEIVYSVNKNLMTFLTIGTVPLMLVFVISLTVSNLALISKEGFRPTNTLGVLTSGVMIVGLAAIVILYRLSSDKEKIWFSVAYSAITPLYILFLILLTSSIIYGIYVSKHNPSYNKDFIIILGCKIRDDGTLYPLIRGRVDRAIKFYHDQCRATGREAVFIPSGGQGDDEVMPEGEAMKRYLIEQGIPESQIIAETKSATTKENMRFSKEIIDKTKKNARVVFSTTSYHVFRSGAIAYSDGINIDGMGSKTKWYFWPNAFLREVAGIFLSHPTKQLLIIVLLALAAGFGSYFYSLV